jgi:hypothetical protein
MERSCLDPWGYVDGRLDAPLPPSSGGDNNGGGSSPSHQARSREVRDPPRTNLGVGCAGRLLAKHDACGRPTS